MPEGTLTVIAFLSLGYLLFAVEMVVPGGILGVLGVISVLFGCWQAFQMGFIWGSSSIVASVVFFFLVIRFFLHSRTGKQLTLSNDEEVRGWKSAREEWKELIGRRGTTLSPLRPSGVVSIDGQRFDVVSDNEFLEADQEVEVVEVEGRRIVVEAVDAETDEGQADEDLSDEDLSTKDDTGKDESIEDRETPEPQ